MNSSPFIFLTPFLFLFLFIISLHYILIFITLLFSIYPRVYKMRSSDPIYAQRLNKDMLNKKRFLKHIAIEALINKVYNNSL